MMTLPIAIMMMEDGDDRSFMGKLYIQHRYLLFRTAYNIVRHPQTAEDIVSEACVSLIENINTLRKLNICKLRAYIVTTVRNVSLDYVCKRDRQSEKYFLTGDEKSFDLPDQAQVDDDLIRMIEVDILRKALRKIHKTERELLQMKYFDMATDAQIAEKFHIGTNSVRYYLTKARRSLRRILEEEEL